MGPNCGEHETDNDSWSSDSDDNSESCCIQCDSNDDDNSTNSSSIHSSVSSTDFCNDNDDGYVRSVMKWVQRVPIGRNLCPWAKSSYRQGNIRCVTCLETSPSKVTDAVQREISTLLDKDSCSNQSWRTTLVVCPNVQEWKNDFEAFAKYVRTISSEEITLVAFHPQFVRWKGLPGGIGLGSKVLCHAGVSGFQKSPLLYPATIVEMTPKVFGQRRVKVRFFESHSNKEQYIPIDWIVLEEAMEEQRQPLSDNGMHRAPFPVIHLILNTDLRNLRVADISRLKRRNAQTMMRLALNEV